MSAPTPQQILSLPIKSPEYTDAKNVGQYLMKILAAYSEQGRDFKVRSPLGVEAWKVPIRDAFRKAGLIDMESYNTDEFLQPALDLLHNADWSSLQEYHEPKDWFPVFLEVGDDGIPVLADYFQNGFTEEEAKRLVETHNTPFDEPRWVAVRIPKES